MTEPDVIIIGGGPAGLSASLWCSELGLSTMLFESRSELGGQLLLTFCEIRNYLGTFASNGRELRDVFVNQVYERGVQAVTDTSIAKVDLASKILATEDGKVFSSKAIVIATGVRRRKLMVRGEDEFRGRGILESGIKAEVPGQTVLIVGGGDAAFENALAMSKTARTIIVVHRRNEFTARREFVDAAKARENIKLFLDTKITEIVGNEMVEGVEIKQLASEISLRLSIDSVLIRIGVEPNTEIFMGQVEIDTAGYLVIDRQCGTSVPGVFAIGDVANPVAPTLSSAVGQGSTAAKAIIVGLINGWQNKA